jgi:transposase-like protein
MPKPHTILPENQTTPEPSLEKRTRRRFSAEYKLKVLAAADACAHGELGVLLRRENLYSSQLQQWRRELASGGVEALSKSAPGPVAAKTPEQRRIEQLEKENARLQRRLNIAEDCIALQKKTLSMLDHANSGSAA